MRNIPGFLRWLFFVSVITSILASCTSSLDEWLGAPPNASSYSRAIEMAKTALENNPEDAEAHFQLGVCYSNLDSVSLAFEHFSKSTEYDPNPKRTKLANNNIKHNFTKHYMMGQKAFEDKNYNVAATEFKKASLADPRQWLAFFKLGVTYTQLGIDNENNYDRAKKAFEGAFHKAPDDDKRIVIDAFDHLLETSSP
jgi:tetratricopeptide (TPR) repeat protein